MQLRILKVNKIARILGSIFLLLLVGCDNNSVSNSSVSVKSTSASSKPTQITQDNKAIFTQNPGNQINVGGILTIDPTLSFTEAIGCKNTVLKSDRLTYKSDEMVKMTNYFDPSNNNKSDGLTIAQGNYVSEIFNWGLAFWIPGCYGRWEVTNISQTSVQIKQINMQLTTDSQPDTYQYRLLDVCSLPATSTYDPCFPQGGGFVPIDYTIKVGQAKASTVFQSQETNGVPPTIDPGQTVQVWVDILPMDESSSFSYTLTPELVLSSATGNDQVFNLTQWTSTIALVNVKRFSCYQFQASTLAPIVPSFSFTNSNSESPKKVKCS